MQVCLGSNSIIPRIYIGLCVKFGVGKATALRAVRCMIYTLYCLAPRFIKWPRGEETTRVIEEFQRTKGFSGVIGAVDSSFIQIRAPKKRYFLYQVYV